MRAHDLHVCLVVKSQKHVLLHSLRAKGTLISEPRFSTPCEMRFFPSETGKTAFSKKNPRDKGLFPFLAWEKSHLAGGRKSDIFYFFLLRGGGRGSSRRRGVGGRFFIENPRRGGLQEGEGPRGRGDVWAHWGIWGGGAKYFFRGRNVHQENMFCCILSRF